MDNGRQSFLDSIMENAQEGKREEMAAALAEHFTPRQEGEFDPEAFRKGIELITSLMKPEAVPEFQRRMNPFGGRGMDDGGEPPEIKNMLVQPNSLKWRDNTPKSTPEELREALECSKKADGMQCDCWNTRCTFFGQCKKCIVFHLCLKQFPTCQRALLGDYEDHYVVFSRDK